MRLDGTLAAADVEAMVKLIILDRDGVINEDSDAFVKSVQEWRPIPGSLEGMARLYHAGYRLVIVTNQSGLARELLGFDALGAIHDKLQRLLGELGGRVDGVFFCPHAPHEACACRKPGAGLLREVSRRFQTELTGVSFIGDKWSDVAAARTVGARPILVTTGYGRRTIAAYGDRLQDVAIFDDLGAAADAIVEDRFAASANG